MNTTGCVRDSSDCKKKWQDISSLTKKKEAFRRRAANGTGGGPAPVQEIKPWEQLVSNIDFIE